jgi:ABC-type Mn2+/Zn2+ transport system ATPase subunit
MPVPTVGPADLMRPIAINAWALRGVACDVAGQSLFTDATFEIPRGQITTVIGPSRAGKSSLLQILGGFRQPSHGTVLDYIPTVWSTLHDQAWTAFRGPERIAEITALQVWDSGALLLDEPDKCIDFTSRMLIYRYLAECAARGTAVVVATHDHKWVKSHKKTVLVQEGACWLKNVCEVDFLAIQKETIEQLRR